MTDNAERAEDSVEDGSRDGCVVDSEPLARAVTEFCDKWRCGGNASSGRFGVSEGDARMSPIDYLAAESRLPRSMIENLSTHRAGHYGRSRHTELRIADPIVQALNQPEMFHDGTLRIQPNPQAKKSLQAACCSGSTEGLSRFQ